MIRNYVCHLLLLTVFLAPAAQGGGGFVLFTTEITDGTVQTILPAGTLETSVADQNGVHVRIGINPSTGASTLTSTNLRYGLSTSIVLDSLTFKIESDGSFTVQRTAGTKTYSVVVRGIWIS